MAIDFNAANTATYLNFTNDNPNPENSEDQQVIRSKNQYDLEAFRKNLAQYSKQIEQVITAITGFEIENEDDAANFLETVGVSKRLLSVLDSERKKTIQKPDGFVRSVNSIFRKFRKPLEDVERIGKQKIGAWNYRQELKRREDEKKMQEEAARQQAEIDKAAKKAGVDSITLPPVVTPKKSGPVRSDTATGSTRYKKVGKVIDFAKLEDRFKKVMVDEKKLQAAIDAGERNIPGVEIEEKLIVSVRAY